MATVPLSQFNAGELSPYLYGRVDLDAYVAGLMRGLNTVVIPHGPAVRRPGGRRAGSAAATAKRGLSFVFGVDDAYTLELLDYEMRFWRADRTQVLDGDGAVFKLATPWTAEQAKTLRAWQSGDVMWLTHPSAPMQELRRTALGPPETFTLAAAEFVDGPYYSENATTATMTTAATGTGAIDVAASVDTFESSDVGRHFRIKLGTVDNSSWAWGKITAFTDAQNVEVTFVTEVSSASATAAWRLGLYSERTGYPSCVCIHQERLCLGSAVAESFPRVDASCSGKFLTFKPGTDDDLALQIVIASRDIPIIRDVMSARVLVVITGSGAMRIASSGTSSALTPTNVDVSPLPTSTGGSLVPAISAAGSIVYLDRQRMSVGEIKSVNAAYADSLVYREISIRNEHLFRDSPAVSLAWADKPWGLICAVREDGRYVLGSYAPDNEVIAFTPQAHGGGTVLSMNTLPTSRGDDIWLLVDRDGERSFEVISHVLRNTEADREAVNVDGAMTWRDAPAATLTRISGDDDGIQTWQASMGVFSPSDVGKALGVLTRGPNNRQNLPTWTHTALRILTVDDADTITVTAEGPALAGPLAAGAWLRSTRTVPDLLPLAGRSVRFLADGADLGPATVSNVGELALPYEAFVVTAGEGYRSELQPLPPNPPTRKGGTVGRPQAAVRTRLRVVRSAGLKQVGWDGQARALMPLRRGADSLGLAPPFYSGDLAMDGAPHDDTPVGPFIVAEGAAPFTITHVAPEVGVGELG